MPQLSIGRSAGSSDATLRCTEQHFSGMLHANVGPESDALSRGGLTSGAGGAGSASGSSCEGDVPTGVARLGAGGGCDVTVGLQTDRYAWELMLKRAAEVGAAGGVAEPARDARVLGQPQSGAHVPDGPEPGSAS